MRKQADICKTCKLDIRNNCLKKEDTLPKDCPMNREYLEMANSIIRNNIKMRSYQVFVEFNEIAAVWYLTKDNIVIATHDHPKGLIGELFLRCEHPELW